MWGVVLYCIDASLLFSFCSAQFPSLTAHFVHFSFFNMSDQTHEAYHALFWEDKDISSVVHKKNYMTAIVQKKTGEKNQGFKMHLE